MKQQFKNDKPASLTVEASLVLPIFLFAMILFSYLGQLIKCQDDMNWALTRIAREASAEYGATKSDRLTHTPYYLAKLNAYVKGTGLSVSFVNSRFMEENDEIDLVADYTMKTPFTLFHIDRIHMQQHVHTRAFTGVEWRGKEKQTEQVKVYVTETGRVYHRSLSCTYLKLSISQVCFGDLTLLRNEGGGKYNGCEKCSKGKQLTEKTKIWITNYGDRYHTTASCSGLKRYIREIALSEVGSRTPCSKCGYANKTGREEWN